MKRVIAAAAMAAGGQTHAQEIALNPLADARARFEHVEQNGLPLDADALTIRVRAGVEARSGLWSALIEGQGTLAAAERFNDGLNGPATRPIVADPENVALYRAQLQYRSPTLAVTAGRQRIALDDERFVGNVAFRQNAQTFDAVRAEWAALPRLKADVTYAWSVRTIWGVQGRGPRQQAVSGDNLFANLSYASPVGSITGFAYLVDQEAAAVQGFRLSTQSYGVRVDGSLPLARDLKLAYQASYARQTDWRRNPSEYAASYYLAEAALAKAAFKLVGGYEVLGASNGAALTSFQTPLGTNFKFQGWADKFLANPLDGVRDLYAGLGHAWPTVGPIGPVTLQAVVHRFRSDRLDRRYGDELNLLATAKIGRTLLSARYADYWARSFATDTRRLWLQADWSL